MKSACAVFCGFVLGVVNVGCEIALEDALGSDAAPNDAAGPDAAVGTGSDAAADAASADAPASETSTDAGVDATTSPPGEIDSGSPPAPLLDPIALDESAMPAWRKNLAVGTWTAIAGTALSSVPISVNTYPTIGYTGPQSKVVAWTSFAFDSRDSSLYSPANGGHHDYAGNEVDRIRLSDDAPTWVEVRESSPPSAVTEDTTHYGDGRPTSRHTYYGAVVDEVRNRVVLVGGGAWGNGNGTSAMDGFHIASSSWDPAGTFPNVPSNFASAFGNALVERKSTGDLYAFGNWSVMRWTSATKSWTTVLASSSIYGQSAASALDTKRNRVLVVGGVADEHAYYDVASNAVVPVTFSDAAGALGGSLNGLIYAPSLDAYLFRNANAGGTIYRIDAATFAVTTFATTGGSNVPSSTNGVFRRFVYVPRLKGVAYVPSYDGNVWFLRTH